MAEKKIEANFIQHLYGMAIQTMIHLGKVPNPIDNKRKVDLTNAAYSIDLLGILEQKTKGNLTQEEETYLSSVLRDLRMEYVEVSKNPVPAEAPEEKPATGE